eukprot:evm.model.scf_822.9 EVM.evm.TU.scf_822.9   scf_822:45700-48701(+)
MESTMDVLPPHAMAPPAQDLPSALADAWAAWDAMVSKSMTTLAEQMGFHEIRNPSPLTSNLPFVSSPAPMVTAWIVYLLTVFMGLAFWRSGAGERLRAARGGKDPAWIRAVVQAHNLVLIALSAYMFATVVWQAWANGYAFWGTGYSDKEAGMARIIYIFFVSKIYEFFDTMVMLLKGNTHQVSFLHVYHHVSISLWWWMITYVAPGGDAWYSASLNSLVHVLMYTYYFTATVLGKNAKLRRKYLWWGKHMTQFQMAQFVSMMAQAAYCYCYSPYPKFLSAGLFVYMQTLLALFMSFYRKKHGESSKRKKGD